MNTEARDIIASEICAAIDGASEPCTFHEDIADRAMATLTARGFHVFSPDQWAWLGTVIAAQGGEK